MIKQKTAPVVTRLRPGAKLFVLDTNVLMHDPTSLFRFEEHDICLPMFVLEELDNKKKGIVYRTTPPKKFEPIVGKIESVLFTDSEVAFNCGGRNVQADGRVYLPIGLVRDLKLTHESVLVWRLSYTASGIKITVEGKR